MPLALLLALTFRAPSPAAAAAASSDAPGIFWRAGFGRAPVWNDGNAEVSRYDARDVKYGDPRTSTAILIVVAEDLLPGKLVKPDATVAGREVRRVLKLNHVRSIQTGVYRYQQMLSAFLGADRLEPVKLTVTSNEWCGNSSVEWRSDRALLSLRSYFEDTGDADVPFAPGDAVFYDALPLALRGLDFGRTRTGTLKIVDTLFTNRPAAPKVEEARLSVSRDLPTAAYRVMVERGARRESPGAPLRRDSSGAPLRRDVFELETAFPHRLLRWDRSDGGSLKLVDSRRFRYWEKNHPGDERLLSTPPTP